VLPLVREPIAALAREGFAIDLVCRPQWSWSAIDGVALLPVAARNDESTRGSLRTFGARAVRGEYAAIIASPVWGLIAADAVGRATRTPVVTLSDRLYTRNDYTPRIMLRRAMYAAQRRSKFTIIPDLARVPPILDDAPGLRDHRFIELPNAAAGEPETSDCDSARGRLGLPADDTLVLYAGTLWAEMGVAECVAAVPHLPPGTTMVIQSVDEVDPIVSELAALAERHEPVLVRRSRLPYPDVDELFAACDIGIVFYQGTGPNFAVCGKASGKLARFLRVGRPVIVDRRGGLEWVAEYGAGEVAATPNDVRGAVQKIAADPDRYRARARACFDEHFRFEKHWPAVRDALAAVMR
jgi:hypothetical protein